MVEKPVMVFMVVTMTMVITVYEDAVMTVATIAPPVVMAVFLA